MHLITDVHLRLVPVSPDGRLRSKVCTHLPNNVQNLPRHETQSCSRQHLMDREPFHLPHYLSPWLVGSTSQQLLCLKTRIGMMILPCSDSARKNPMSGTSSRFVSVYA